MALNLGELFITIGAKTKELLRGEKVAHASIKRIDGNIKKSTKGLKLFLGAAAGLGIGLAATRGIRATARAFFEFDDAMTQSLAIMGDVTVALEQDMVRAAREVAAATVFSATQAAESYFFLASAGLDAAASIAALPVVSRFAQAGMFDMALATDLLTDAQSALGLTIRDNAVKNMENMVRVSNVLVKANTLANASVRQFSEALTTKAAASMRLAGIEIEEGVAILALFADQGVKSARAGTAFSIVVRELQRAAVDNKGAFKALGIEIFDTGDGLADMADISRDLTRVLAPLPARLQVAALNALGLKARTQEFVKLLIGGEDVIRGYLKQMEEMGDISKEVSDKQLNSLGNQFKLLAGRIRDATAAAFDFTKTPLVAALKIINEPSTGGASLAEAERLMRRNIELTDPRPPFQGPEPAGFFESLRVRITQTDLFIRTLERLQAAQKAQEQAEAAAAAEIRRTVILLAEKQALETRVGEIIKSLFTEEEQLRSVLAEVNRALELGAGNTKAVEDARARLLKQLADLTTAEERRLVKERLANEVARETDAILKERARLVSTVASIQNALLTNVERQVIAEQALVAAVKENIITNQERLRILKLLPGMFDTISDAELKAKRNAEELGFTIANAFEDAIFEAQKLSDVLKQLARDLLRTIFRQQITDPLAGTIGDFLGGFGGGRVAGGSDGPRLNTGPSALGRARGGGSGTTVQIFDQRTGGADIETQETTGRDGERLLRLVIRDEIATSFNGGTSERILTGRFGVTRKVVGR